MHDNQSYQPSIPVIELDEKSRGQFISRTYNHLFVAISVFTLLEIFLFKAGWAEPMAKAMLGTSWLLVLGGFMVVSWLARGMAHRAGSKPAQYAALAGYVVAQAIIFVPLLWVANQYAPGTITSAAAITFGAFTALTLVVFHPQRFHLPAGQGLSRLGCKTIIGARCKQFGMFWGEPGAENVPALRCIQASRRLDQFWKALLNAHVARNDCLSLAA